MNSNSESPLLKLRQELVEAREFGHWTNWHKAEALLTEAEERWVLERELHKDQVKRIRKARHEYIMALREQVRVQDDVIRDLTAMLRMEAGE